MPHNKDINHKFTRAFHIISSFPVMQLVDSMIQSNSTSPVRDFFPVDRVLHVLPQMIVGARDLVTTHAW
jgi:hypothetical protein